MLLGTKHVVLKHKLRNQEALLFAVVRQVSVERGSSHNFWLARLVWNQVLFRLLVVRVHKFFILKCARPSAPKSSSIHAEPREWTLASQCWSSGFVGLNLNAIFTTLSIRSVHYVKWRYKNIKAIGGYAFLSYTLYSTQSDHGTGIAPGVLKIGTVVKKRTISS